MPATVPAWTPGDPDISDAPDDWLQAWFVYVNEEPRGEDDFAQRIQAIYTLRDIERRDGVRRYATWQEAKAELIRRGLREPDPEPEFIGRADTIAAIREHMNVGLHEARYWATFIKSFQRNGRQWYRREDLRAFFHQIDK